MIFAAKYDDVYDDDDNDGNAGNDDADAKDGNGDHNGVGDRDRNHDDYDYDHDDGSKDGGKQQPVYSIRVRASRPIVAAPSR